MSFSIRVPMSVVKKVAFEDTLAICDLCWQTSDKCECAQFEDSGRYAKVSRVIYSAPVRDVDGMHQVFPRGKYAYTTLSYGVRGKLLPHVKVL